MSEFMNDSQLEEILALKNCPKDMFKIEERKGLSKENIPSQKLSEEQDTENLKKQLALKSMNVLELEAVIFAEGKKYKDEITDLKNIIKQLRKEFNDEKERRREGEERAKISKSSSIKEIEELKNDIVQLKMRHSVYLSSSKREIKGLKCDLQAAQEALESELQKRDTLEELLDVAKLHMGNVAGEREALQSRIAAAEAEAKGLREAARRAVAEAAEQRARAEGAEKAVEAANRELQEAKEKKRGSWFW